MISRSSSRSFQIPSECTIYRPCFNYFFLQFQIVSNAVIMNHLPTLFSFLMQFQIPSECTMYRPCYHFFCSSISFQMPPECTLYRPCFQPTSSRPLTWTPRPAPVLYNASRVITSFIIYPSMYCSKYSPYRAVAYKPAITTVWLLD